jgi:hypothetical protein
MKVLKIVALGLAVIVAILAWVSPVGPMPGIFIGGTPSPLPDVWSDTRQVHEIELEVSGGLVPRVVIIWVVQVDGDLHVVGFKGSGWTSALGTGGSIRMRMGDKTYELDAHLVTSGWQPILEAYLDKYRADYPDIVEGFPALEEAKEIASVYRLTAPDTI